MTNRVCVIGAGRWGKNHIRTLHEMGELGGIIDTRVSVLTDIAAQYPGVKTFTSISDPGALDFSAYTIAVPAPLHDDLAKLLIQNKKHVMVEKPITLTSDSARNLVKLAETNDVVLMTGHLLLFHNAFRTMKTLIESNKIGKLQYIYSNRLNLGTVRTEENSLWSFAPHDIALFQYLTESTPTDVDSKGGAFLQPHIHDTSLTSLSYPNNVKGHIFVSWLHPFKEHRFVVIGSKGMLVFEDSSQDKDLFFYEKGIDWINGEPIKRDGPTEKIDYTKNQPLQEELAHFLACIEGKALNNLISGKHGVEVLSILEKAHEALCSNQTTSQHDGVKHDYFVHDQAVIHPSAKIGSGTKIWQFSAVLKEAVIGENCILGQNVNVGNNVSIGNNCKIQNNVSIYEGVELEDYVFCGPSMVFTNINIPRSKYPQANARFYQKTLVKEGASIGANATIVCGSTLGRFCLIGAGAVVTKDVPDFALILGNPGKIAGWFSEGGKRLDFTQNNVDHCEKSGKWYHFNGNTVDDYDADPTPTLAVSATETQR